MPDKRPIAIDDLCKIVYVEDPNISPDEQWIAFVKVSIDRLDNSYRRDIWLAPTDGGEPIQLTRSGKDSQPRWSPDGRTLAFTSARADKPQIYLMPVTAPGGEPRALTSLQNGATNPVWSPDGAYLAFLSPMNAEERRRDGEGEQESPPANKFEAKQRKERKEHEEESRFDPRYIWRIPYRVGTGFLDDRYAQIFVIPVAEGVKPEDAKPRRLTDVDASYSAPQWMSDGRHIVAGRAIDPEADEPYEQSALFLIDVETAAEQQLTGSEFASDLPLPSPDGAWIAYIRVPRQNITRHMNRLAVIPSAGGEPRDLTLEFDRAPEFLRWLPDSTGILFGAGDQGDLELYHISPQGGEVTKVVTGRMEIQGFDVGKLQGIAFGASSPASPPELYWKPLGADDYLQMTEFNSALLDEIIVQPVHELRWHSHDGLEIQGWYILPVGYEQGSHYPLVFHIHGGPHVMWGPSTRTMWHEWQLHAARGYVVFYSNPRGANGYGQAFHDGVARAWGEADFPDLMAGIDALLELDFVDREHMAVTGGSYGGFMTAWVIGHTDRFCAAVSQRGVYSLTSFYGTSDVPLLISSEFGVEPWQAHALLWEYSPLAHAHKIKTPLLLLHSENDYRVPIEQAEQLFATVRRSTDTPVTMWRYPREGHELSRSGEPEHRISRLTKMLEWIDRYCKPDKHA